MTTAIADPALHPCACGDPDCSEMVRGTYARGHYAKMASRAAKGLLPDDDLDGDDDPGDSDGGLPPELETEINQRASIGNEGEVPADKPPGRLKDKRGGKPSPPRTASKVKVTGAIRADVHAKIRFALRPLGGVWQARDQICGSAFLEQEPAISDAVADLVCDSPDLLAFFTGPGGGFMKYLKLAMACQPVAMVLWMHHIVHAIADGPDGQPVQAPAFAA